MTQTVLVVEDEPKTARLLADYLAAGGFAPHIVGDGLDAIAFIRNRAPDAVLLDLNLPGCDGADVCRDVRRFSAVPIIMITARIDEVARLAGLDIGADDYICKPFSPNEVMARLRALLRRAGGHLSPDARSDWQVDEAGLRIAFRQTWLTLTLVEFRLLKTFLAQPGRVFARDQLLDRAHDDFRDVSDRAIDSHVKNIRKKVAAAGADPELISSIYGVGYRFTP